MDIKELIETRYPGLFAGIRQQIEGAEPPVQTRGGDSHLWEHSLYTASLAAVLAEREGVEPLVPVLAGLLHDAGKFKNQSYHGDLEPEESEAVRISRKLLNRHQVSPVIRKEVAHSIGGLYREGGTGTEVTDILHDADFLSKSGALGIALYFTKGVLRGRNLFHWIRDTASRELTYSLHLAANMRTTAGKEFAGREGRTTGAFFQQLFREMREKGIGDWVIRDCPVRKTGERHPLPLQIVAPRICGDCGVEPAIAFSFEKGIKCEKVKARIHCPSCGEGWETGFCLPEICRG